MAVARNQFIGLGDEQNFLDGIERLQLRRDQFFFRKIGRADGGDDGVFDAARDVGLVAVLFTAFPIRRRCLHRSRRVS